MYPKKFVNLKDLELGLKKYPEVKAFLESNSPNIILPKNIEKKYSLQCGSTTSCWLTLFEFACFFGKIIHLEAFGYNEEEKQKAVKADDYSVIQLAAENGQTDTIRYLETYLIADEKKQAVKMDNYKAIRGAAQNGHIDVIQYLETHLTAKEKKQAVMTEEYDAIWAAAQNGNIDILRYLETHLTADEKKTSSNRRSISRNSFRCPKRPCRHHLAS